MSVVYVKFDVNVFGIELQTADELRQLNDALATAARVAVRPYIRSNISMVDGEVSVEVNEYAGSLKGE